MDNKLDVNDIDDSDITKCRKSLLLLSIFSFIWSSYVISFENIEIFQINVQVGKSEAALLIIGFSLYLILRFLQLRNRNPDKIYSILKNDKMNEAVGACGQRKALILANKKVIDESESKDLVRREYIPSGVLVTEAKRNDLYPSMRKPKKYKTVVSIKYVDHFTNGGKGGSTGFAETVFFDEIDVFFWKIIAWIKLNFSDTHFLEYNFPLIVSLPILFYSVFKFLFQ